MTLEGLLKDYTAYNSWANEVFVKWLRSKPETAMTTPVVSKLRLYAIRSCIYGELKRFG